MVKVVKNMCTIIIYNYITPTNKSMSDILLNVVACDCHIHHLCVLEGKLLTVNVDHNLLATVWNRHVNQVGEYLN